MHTSAVRATLRHPAGPKLSILFCFHSHSYRLSKARVRNVGKSGGSLSRGGTLALKAGLSSHNDIVLSLSRPPRPPARPTQLLHRRSAARRAPRDQRRDLRSKVRQAHTFNAYVITIYSMHADGMLTSLILHVAFVPISRTSVCASFAAPRDGVKTL